MIHTALSHLLPEQYFRGDVLRLLFDYLMVSFDLSLIIDLGFVQVVLLYEWVYKSH